MERIVKRAAGVDAHKDVIVAEAHLPGGVVEQGAGLRLRAYPPSHPISDRCATIIDKHYYRLVLDWPPQPDHHST